MIIIQIANHSCTWVENPGDKVANIFVKTPGGKAFRTKLPGGSPIFFCNFCNFY